MKLDNVAKTGLFVDPYAERLAGEEGLSMLEKAILEVGDQPAITIRTRYIDNQIEEALSEGVQQIVILAAGMDARAYRMTFPKGTRVFELDRQVVLDYKKEKLKEAKANCQRFEIGVDLKDEWQHKLVKAGWNKGEKTLWLTEGLLMYLEESEVLTLLDKINSLSLSKSILVFDIVGQTLLDSPFMAKQLQFLKEMGAPWKFGTDQPEQMMSEFGWDAVASQPSDVAPTRWPFPSAPLSVRNIPRGFYIKAVKR